MKTFEQFMAEATNFNESITRRKNSGRALAPRGYFGALARAESSDKAALKKAGFRRLSSSDYRPEDNTRDFKSRRTNNSPSHATTVYSDKNQTTFARGDAPEKTISTRGTKSKVTPTKKRVHYLRTLKKQLGGTRTERPVHTIEISTKTDKNNKNDPKELVSRGKSFKQELQNVPKSLKKARAKSGDIVIGEPLGTMPGEDSKKGTEKRAKLYQKTFGAKLNPKTGLMVGRARLK